MERRLAIGMAGVLLMTLVALFAPLYADTRACPGAATPDFGCDRFAAASLVAEN